MLIDNVPGVGGSIGADKVAKLNITETARWKPVISGGRVKAD